MAELMDVLQTKGTLGVGKNGGRVVLQVEVYGDEFDKMSVTMAQEFIDDDIRDAIIQTLKLQKAGVNPE